MWEALIGEQQKCGARDKMAEGQKEDHSMRDEQRNKGFKLSLASSKLSIFDIDIASGCRVWRCWKIDCPRLHLFQHQHLPRRLYACFSPRGCVKFVKRTSGDVIVGQLLQCAWGPSASAVRLRQRIIQPCRTLESNCAAKQRSFDLWRQGAPALSEENSFYDCTRPR